LRGVLATCLSVDGNAAVLPATGKAKTMKEMPDFSCAHGDAPPRGLPSGWQGGRCLLLTSFGTQR